MTARARTSVLDPIDVVTGECYLDRVDFTLPGPVPIEWKAYYSNQLGRNGPLGHNWTYTFDRFLAFGPVGVSYATGAGSQVSFLGVPEPSETLESPDGRYRLERPDENTFRLFVPENQVLTFEGAPAGRVARLIRLENLNGVGIDFFHNKSGVLQGIRDSQNRQLILESDAEGRITEVSCRRESAPKTRVRLVSYQYDARGDLVSVTDAAGFEQSYVYDEHRLTKRTDRNGYSFRYRYKDDRVIETRGDDGLFPGKFTYDLEARTTVFTGHEGREIRYVYNEQYMVVEEIDPYGHTTATEYDPAGNRIVVTDRVGRASAFAYDDRGNVVKEIAATGAITETKYNERNQVTERIHPDGKVEVKEYDARGNLTFEKSRDGVKTFYRYRDDGLLKVKAVEGLPPEQYQYDPDRQLVAVKDFITGDVLRTYKYDLLGNAIEVVRPARGTWRYGFDPMGRMLEQLWPDGTKETNAFDPEGNATLYVDRLGKRWEYRYRGYQQLVEVVAPDGGITRYDYTPASETLRIVDPLGNATEYIRDLCDRVVEVRSNGTPSLKLVLDAEGRVLVREAVREGERREQAFQLHAEPMSRKVTVNGAEEETAFEYDLHGRLMSAANSSGAMERAYDEHGSLVSEQLDGRGVEHVYDDAGNLIQTLIEGEVTIRYDREGEDLFIQDPSGKWSRILATEDGVEEAVFANGVTETRSFEELLLREYRVEKLWGEAPIAAWTFETDALDRPVIAKSQRGQRSYKYDPCGRLAAVQGAWQGPGAMAVETFAYDAAGNRTGSEGSVGAGNRLASWKGRRFGYDAAGRVVEEMRQAGRFLHVYANESQIGETELPDGKKVRRRYDALGRRISKTSGDKESLLVWEGDRLVSETLPAGGKRFYAYARAGDVSPILFCDRIPDTKGATATRVYYVHYDEARRPYLITDEVAEAAWSATYSAYGRATVDPRSRIDYSLRAPGQYYDAETDLHDNRFRTYDPDTGRFLQPDPLGLRGGINPYLYGSGDPLAACDVLGLADG